MKHPSTTEPSLLSPFPNAGTKALDTATLELLACWRFQDATNDPELIRQAEQELAEFKEQMNVTGSPPEPPLFIREPNHRS